MAKRKKKQIKTIKHDEAKRTYIPTAEYEPMMRDDEQTPMTATYERRNHDLDPQLMWRGKDEQDWSELVVPAPPLYIQEKVHPKVLIDDLVRESAERAERDTSIPQLNMFADFNGVPDGAEADFYAHEANWTNRMILGDSLQVMASLAEREALRGKVQCIYIDPPYGIKFNSNFQWSTTSRDVKDGNLKHLTREPEQVKAFRDTWRDGIHSYLTYLRDRLTVARDLLTESGSIFVQIGEENVHRVRDLLDEVFGEDNFCSTIQYNKTSGFADNLLPNVSDYILWYAKSKGMVKYRQLLKEKQSEQIGKGVYSRIEMPDGTRRRMADEDNLSSGRIFRVGDLTSQGHSETASSPLRYQGKTYPCSKNRHWTVPPSKITNLFKADRVTPSGKSLAYVRYWNDYTVQPMNNNWADTGTGSFTDPKIYVVQSGSKAVQRCVLMVTDPSDLVLDATCGSGTTAYVAEQWGRRWITIDTSRVSLALARARLMGARYPFYLLADSKEGQQKESDITGKLPSQQATYNNIRQGFVYERVPRITLKAIANNSEIDTIWETYHAQLEPLRTQLNDAVGAQWEAWEIPREIPDETGETWSDVAKTAHHAWWELRIARQQEIDGSIARNADQEFLYDKPYQDNKKVRVAGPFTVESISPHRTLTVDEDDEVLAGTYGSGDQFVAETGNGYGASGETDDFVTVILDNLRTAGVQQAHKEDRISFTSLTPWPGQYVCAEARYLEGETETERKAGIFIGPEFGTVQRRDLVDAARECADAGFDVLIGCAFNYDAHSAEFEKLGRVPVLKARMNSDLHMASDLANTGAGNLFVIFGEPDIEILDAENGQIRVQIHGVDVFHPQSGKVESSEPDDIAIWFIDTDYNSESFFVRHAYFLGANDPYKSLKTTLKAEIDAEAWGSLHSAVSRPFDRPKSGRIAVKVINHLGDEVMKLFSV